MRVGDRFAIELPDGAVYDYDIAAIDVIDSDRELLRLFSDESLVALVTCWPFDAIAPGSTQRYVVSVSRIDSGATHGAAMATIH